MGVTLALVATTAIVGGVGAALSVSRYRKHDEALKSLGACFKFD